MTAAHTDGGTTVVEAGQAELLGAAARTGHTVAALVSAWLGSFADSADTRAAYARDLREYLAWCTRRRLDPLAVRLPEVQMYAAELAAFADLAAGRRENPCTAEDALEALYAAEACDRSRREGRPVELAEVRGG